MKANKINWKKKGIEELMFRYGYDYNVAKTIYMRIYKKAWYETKHKGKVEGINIAYETYVSTFGYENSVKLFDISFDDLSYKLDFASQFKYSKDVQIDFILERFKGFKEAYGESSINFYGDSYTVDEMYQRFKDSQIDYDTFIDYVEQFRCSTEYNKQHYKG